MIRPFTNALTRGKNFAGIPEVELMVRVDDDETKDDEGEGSTRGVAGEVGVEREIRY